VNLASAKGKEINGRVSKISGPMKNGRYPLNLKHISGDEEIVSLKAQNLNPFFKLSEEEERSSKRCLAFVNYGNPIRGSGNRACVPEGHGRMLKNCITCLKWNLMHIQPMPFFVNVTQDEFAEQFEGNLGLTISNKVFTICIGRFQIKCSRRDNIQLPLEGFRHI